MQIVYVEYSQVPIDRFFSDHLLFSMKALSTCLQITSTLVIPTPEDWLGIKT